MAKYPNEPDRQQQQAQGSNQSQTPGQTQGPPAQFQPGQRLNVQFVTEANPIDTAFELNKRGPLTVAFPPCAEEIVSLVKTTDQDEITTFFNEYFVFNRHLIFGNEPVDRHPDEYLDPKIGCPQIFVTSRAAADVPQPESRWPSTCCICSPCLTLDGNRNPPPKPPYTTVPHLRRLFLGDVLWAFYFDRMGIHQILGAILDAFAYNGRLPISNGSIDLATYRDDITALVLEIMVRQTKTGLSSTVRDRNALFRTIARLGHRIRPQAESRHAGEHRIQLAVPQVHLPCPGVLPRQTAGGGHPGRGRRRRETVRRHAHHHQQHHRRAEEAVRGVSVRAQLLQRAELDPVDDRRSERHS